MRMRQAQQAIPAGMTRFVPLDSMVCMSDTMYGFTGTPCAVVERLIAPAPRILDARARSLCVALGSSPVLVRGVVAGVGVHPLLGAGGAMPRNKHTQSKCLDPPLLPVDPGRRLPPLRAPDPAPQANSKEWKYTNLSPLVRASISGTARFARFVP